MRSSTLLFSSLLRYCLSFSTTIPSTLSHLFINFPQFSYSVFILLNCNLAVSNGKKPQCLLSCRPWLMASIRPWSIRWQLWLRRCVRCCWPRYMISWAVSCQKYTPHESLFTFFVHRERRPDRILLPRKTCSMNSVLHCFHSELFVFGMNFLVKSPKQRTSLRLLVASNHLF